MFAMRSKYIAFVQRNWNCVDVMISIPQYVDACFVLICHGFIHIRRFLAHNVFLVFHSGRQRHVRTFNVHNAQETGVSALRTWQILNFQFYLFWHFVGQQNRFIIGIRFVMRTSLMILKIDKIFFVLLIYNLLFDCSKMKHLPMPDL